MINASKALYVLQREPRPALTLGEWLEEANADGANITDNELRSLADDWLQRGLICRDHDTFTGTWRYRVPSREER